VFELKKVAVIHRQRRENLATTGWLLSVPLLKESPAPLAPGNGAAVRSVTLNLANFSEFAK